MASFRQLEIRSRGMSRIWSATYAFTLDSTGSRILSVHMYGGHRLLQSLWGRIFYITITEADTVRQRIKIELILLFNH